MLIRGQGRYSAKWPKRTASWSRGLEGVCRWHRERVRCGRPEHVDRGQEGASSPSEGRTAAFGLSATIRRQHGAAPPGLFRGHAARPCQPVHARRASRVGRDCSRGRVPWSLHARHRSHRGLGRCVAHDGQECPAGSAAAWTGADRVTAAHGVAKRAEYRHHHVAQVDRMAAPAPKGSRVKFANPTHTGV